jgi:hypothetical protein
MTHETEAVNKITEIRDPTAATVCLNIIEQYQAGNLYKGDAIYEFTKATPAGENETKESPGKTLESYISMLNDWDGE